MNIQFEENNHEYFEEFLKDKIRSFNTAHWKDIKKEPLILSIKDEDEKVLGGVSSKTFGRWLLIDNFWITPELRGKKIGQGILKQLEARAIERGCEISLLDTLDFQAKPFYEKFGYEVVWSMENYPVSGERFYMMKKLK